MQQKHSSISVSIFFIFCLTFFVIGCSAPATFLLPESSMKMERGQAIIEEGEDITEQAEDMIEDGEDMISEGERLKRKGDDLIEEGRDLRKEGKERVAEGKKIIKSVETLEEEEKLRRQQPKVQGGTTAP
ncbi:hypothetical protein [Desulfonema magnum]|uniref:Uncharacterized protein n=1 Tax=Desulfonema magnum TaxID=45655 RepID=A0A975BFZ5_9BACT|nr:hypothetical protein [Desulfonema magnum]QTA84370.1 Uncharacterized protein dnm_003640 [Desulfonema magnum]